jgi:hypothetical protein
MSIKLRDIFEGDQDLRIMKMEVSLIKHITFLSIYSQTTPMKKIYISEQELTNLIKTQKNREIINVISLLNSLKMKPLSITLQDLMNELFTLKVLVKYVFIFFARI